MELSLQLLLCCLLDKQKCLWGGFIDIWDVLPHVRAADNICNMFLFPFI